MLNNHIVSIVGLRKEFRRLKRRISSILNANDINLELGRIADYKHLTAGYAHVFDKPFKFHHGPSFVDSYREIFETEIYQFKPSGTSKIILDCGANMGLSVLYFSIHYPDHHIIAFEPDAEIFSILEENVKTFGLKNITLHQKAVWTKTENLKFYTDGGMGGRVGNEYAHQEPKIVEAVPLLDFLTEDVDFLKIDIEGAEDTVLKYCGKSLQNANHIFFEYHNNVNSKQTLHELLALVESLGFYYYVKESEVRKHPFIDQHLICETFNMALNVFCYKV
ncbi:FkbM family methyltransferase [Daejeonella sp.]|jgi:FkbM family methyltransferase|uniref:FkbM family methyltransferase n=1 Tax=Daejeonella sp. TaxID=2805397 RepID=UPI0037C0A8A6